MKTAYFNRFEIEMSDAAAVDCHHQGACDDGVAYWAGADWQGATRISRIARPDTITPAALAAELKDCGAWDAEELADDDQSWQRIIWLAAGNIQEGERA